MSRLLPILRLTRPKVSLMAAGSTFVGALLAGQGDVWTVLAAVCGALALCSGCSALNQVQEREQDALMLRTHQRPLPSGEMTLPSAMTAALALQILGLALFFLAGGLFLLGLGFTVILVYNGLYTPLKRRTALALFVGAVVGAFPPLVGWIAGGGDAMDPRILAVCALFYLWQGPHFWLLAEKHREDYARAGFKAPASVLPQRIYRFVLALWVTAYFMGVAVLLALFHGGAPAVWGAGLALAFGLAAAGGVSFGRYAGALRAVNGAMLAVLCGLPFLM